MSGHPVDPRLSLAQAQAVVATKTAQRVTEASIKDKIAAADYIVNAQTALTICTLTMTNGFNVVGISASASPENYDEEVGKRYAFDNAFKQLWQLEGYLLRERLFWQSQEITAQTAGLQAHAGKPEIA